MKSTGLLLILSVLLTVMTACSEKKAKNQDIITTNYEAPKPTEPKAMEPKVYSTPVKWVEGREYQVNIERAAAPSLPMVKDANGQEYVDNTVTISVTRADNSVFFKQQFGKASFEKWADDEYRENAILEDITFFEIGADELSFIASLNFPHSGDDEALELLLELDRMGNVNIAPFTYDDREDLKQQENQ